MREVIILGGVSLLLISTLIATSVRGRGRAMKCGYEFSKLDTTNNQYNNNEQQECSVRLYQQ